MLTGLLVFLIGCLIVAVVIYVSHLIIDMLTLPPQVKQIALIILALICLVIVLILAIRVVTGGDPMVIHL